MAGGLSTVIRNQIQSQSGELPQGSSPFFLRAAKKLPRVTDAGERADCLILLPPGAPGGSSAGAGVYIGRADDTNGLTESATALTNTISINADGNAVILASGGAYLRFNSASNQMRFRYYKSSTYTNQKAIALYKLVEG